MTKRRKYESLHSSQVERDANEKSKRVYNLDLGNPARLALRCVSEWPRLKKAKKDPESTLLMISRYDKHVFPMKGLSSKLKQI